MDFVRYAERAAELVNAELADEDAVARLLDGSGRLRPTPGDVSRLRALQSDLRTVFEASDGHREQAVVTRLNELLAEHPVTPYISGHDAGAWHLHVADTQRTVAEQLAAESVLGLSVLVCELGARRLGVCHSSPCTNVYVDTSPNQSRRYCSERCSSRANVAAFRARQRLTTGRTGVGA